MEIRAGRCGGPFGFAHIRGDRGYVFLLNPSAVEQVAELALALDAPQATNFGVEEVFPGGMSLQGPAGGLYPLGGKLRVTVPAKQVRIIWIAPAQATDPQSPRLAGGCPRCGGPPVRGQLECREIERGQRYATSRLRLPGEWPALFDQLRIGIRVVI